MQMKEMKNSKEIQASDESSGENQAAPMPKWEKYLKIGILVFMAAVLVYVILDFTVMDLGNINGILVSFLRWIRQNPIEGVFAFAAVYMVTTVMFIPGSLLTLGAGFVFGRAVGLGLGVLLGSISVLLGASAGAILSFLLGRYVLYEQAQRLLSRYKIMKSIDTAIESEGLKVMFLLRLSPVIPFSVLNYLLGLTKAMFRNYAIAMFGIIPGTVAFVFIGTSASGLLGDDDDMEDNDMEGDQSAGLVQLLVFIIGGFFTIVAIVVLTWYAKRYLNKILAEANEDNMLPPTLDGDIEDKDAKDEESTSKGTGHDSTAHSADKKMDEQKKIEMVV